MDMDNYNRMENDGERGDSGGSTFMERLSQRTESFLNMKVGSGKINWGLVIMGLVAIYAAFNLVRGILFFFN